MRWFLVLLVGCGFSSKLDGVPGDGDADVAAIDAPPDAFDERCFGHADFYFCLPALPTGNITLPGASIDTTPCGLGAIHTVAGVSACVIAGDRISLASGDTVGVLGDKPLVLVAVTELRIGGLIDASSVRGNLGPAANATSCTPKGGVTNADGGGGGAGGSFGGAGGNGGNGAGGAGATAAPTVTAVTTLRGGCPGGPGAIGNGGAPTTPGPGGGAIYLVARGTLALDGTINANGGGGGGSPGNKIGGAGGGSGGLIVLDGGTLTVTAGARIVANGGGGAAGSGQANAGAAGFEGAPNQPSVPAGGGPSSTGGAMPGGNGFAGTTQPMPGTANPGGGGGGGGGGAGVIRIRGGTIATPQVSPSPTPI